MRLNERIERTKARLAKIESYGKEVEPHDDLRHWGAIILICSAIVSSLIIYGVFYAVGLIK